MKVYRTNKYKGNYLGQYYYLYYKDRQTKTCVKSSYYLSPITRIKNLCNLIQTSAYPMQYLNVDIKSIRLVDDEEKYTIDDFDFEIISL